ncbi:hypothetical protein [Clostridium felsineum]|uniref:Uncharacterized protein n=1 Tax=Clostridium felsineum TaxID=36839 RepID=A0A1S8L3Y9_9CLOT|nr:hypothetical protein [Clostridium felsineum]URZ07557.1 hypothetical protein CLROS_028960 [Clostridium felsineum]URZ12588.1 hypothetical protein CROST_033110 [Clostridium felsineum]
MAKYRHIYTIFWEDPDVMENFTPEDKLFYLYLLTNPRTTQIGVYQILKKEIAFELGYSIESVNSLISRFVEHHKIIKYNDKTREIAIKNWGKYNLKNSGKPIRDCINSELPKVKDKELLIYVLDAIENDEISNIFNNFIYGNEVIETSKSVDNSTNNDKFDASLTCRGQNIKYKKENIKINNNNIYMQNDSEKIDTEIETKKISSDETSDICANKIPYDEICKLFNNTCVTLPKVKILNNSRRKSIKAAYDYFKNDLTAIEEFFERVEKSDFLTGREGNWTGCSFDWIMKQSNRIKVIEGNYDNKHININKSSKQVDNFNNYTQRKYDYDALERRLLGWNEEKI